MRINHNISSLTTQNAMFKTNRDLTKSIEKLSTGIRINRASDDAAGLAVSENLRTQVRGLSQALKNTQDAISLLNIADGALQEQADIVQRMRELVIQAKNDTYTQTERNYMGEEFLALFKEVDRIAYTTNFNGMRLFSTRDDRNALTTTEGAPKIVGDAFDIVPGGIFGQADNGSATYFNMIIGANYTSEDIAAHDATSNSFSSDSENFITFELGQMDANGLLRRDADLSPGTNAFQDLTGVAQNYNAFDHSGATFMNNRWGDSVNKKLSTILSLIDGDTPEAPSAGNPIGSGENITGLKRINTMRSYIGSLINRLEFNLSNLMTGETNQQAAESQIRDTDFASETAKFTKQQILMQSSTAMLAQANSTPQSVLSLLQ
ncbi:MAG: flagellin [Chitinivibrionales bacterium]|nr:flagellin [Chitinivibrionales bacterium]